MRHTEVFDFIYRQTGLKVDPHRRNDVIRIMEDMFQSTGVNSMTSLMMRLAQYAPTADIWEPLVDRITIGETYFFRNAYHFKALQSHVLPEIIAKKQQQGVRHLRIWSAGCSTGEEPYSIAMLLREIVPDIDTWSIQILATDINLNNLKIARTGHFRSNSFRGETRSDIQDRWFTKNGTGWILDPRVQRMVQFKPLNLVTDEYPSIGNQTAHMDMIICRNVTIYFDEATTRRVVDRFYEALNPEGWLIVGHSEPMISTYENYKVRNFENAILYQKASGTFNPWAAPPAVPARISFERVVEKPQVKPIQPKPVYTPSAPPKRVVKEVPVEEEEAPLWQQAKESADLAEWEKAVRLLEVAERETPMVPQVHYLRGLIFLQENALEDAFQAFRRAIYCDPSFVLAYYNLGELYVKRGNIKEARRQWEKSLSIVNKHKAQDYLPFGEDLTVEMFQELVGMRLADVGKGR